MPQVELLRTVDELEALAPEWEALWREDRRATPFQSPAWLVPWAASFADNRPWALAIREAGALAALLPACVYQRQLMLLGAGTTDYCDWLVRPGFEQPALAALRTALSDAEGEDWDTAEFVQLREDSALLGLGATRSAEHCSRIRHSLPAKLLGNINYYRRRAQALGPLRCTVAETPKAALSSYEQLTTLHTARWQERGEQGVLADPRVLAHHRAAIPLLHACGALRIFRLHAGEELLGLAYVLADASGAAERNYYYYLTAFAPQHRALSPGTLVLAAVVDAAKREGMRSVDMLRGRERYKDLWGVERVETSAVSLAPPSRPSLREELVSAEEG